MVNKNGEKRAPNGGAGTFDAGGANRCTSLKGEKEGKITKLETTLKTFSRFLSHANFQQWEKYLPPKKRKWVQTQKSNRCSTLIIPLVGAFHFAVTVYLNAKLHKLNSNIATFNRSRK